MSYKVCIVCSRPFEWGYTFGEDTHICSKHCGKQYVVTFGMPPVPPVPPCPTYKESFFGLLKKRIESDEDREYDRSKELYWYLDDYYEELKDLGLLK